MDSKESSKYCVNEMVSFGTSKESLIYKTTSKAKKPPVNPDLATVTFSVKSTRKTTVFLAILVIAVALVAFFGGPFVS